MKVEPWDNDSAELTVESRAAQRADPWETDWAER